MCPATWGVPVQPRSLAVCRWQWQLSAGRLTGLGCCEATQILVNDTVVIFDSYSRQLWDSDSDSDSPMLSAYIALYCWVDMSQDLTVTPQRAEPNTLLGLYQ